MVKLFIIFTFCVFVVSGTHYYEIKDEENLDLRSREIYFDERHPNDQEQNEKLYIRPRRQVSNDVMVHHFEKPFWGPRSQTTNSKGFASPISYSGKINAFSKAGHGMSGNINAILRVRRQTSMDKRINALNTPVHQVTARDQRNRNVDNNFRISTPERNGFIVYNNTNNDASVTSRRNHVSRRPNNGFISGSMPKQLNNGFRESVPRRSNNGFVGESVPRRPNNGFRESVPRRSNNGFRESVPRRSNNGFRENVPRRSNSGFRESVPRRPNYGFRESVPVTMGNRDHTRPDGVQGTGFRQTNFE